MLRAASVVLLAARALPVAGHADDRSLGSQVYVTDVVRGGESIVGAAPGMADGLAGSPDGTRLAFVREDLLGFVEGVAGLWVMNTNGGEQRRLLGAECGFCIGPPAWSPNGRRIAFVRASANASEAGLWTIDSDGTNVRLLARDAYNDGQRPQWSPDGSRIAYVYADASTCAPGYRNCATWTIRVVRATGGDPQIVATHAHRPAWSRDARWLAFHRIQGGEDFGLYAVRSSGGRVRAIWPKIGTSFVTWSRSGSRLAYTWRGALYSVRLDARQRRRVLRLTTPGFALAYSPRRDRIAFAHVSNPGVWVMRADGTARRRLVAAPQGAVVRWLQWSRDGRRIFYIR